VGLKTSIRKTRIMTAQAPTLHIISNYEIPITYNDVCGKMCEWPSRKAILLITSFMRQLPQQEANQWETTCATNLSLYFRGRRPYSAKIARKPRSSLQPCLEERVFFCYNKLKSSTLSSVHQHLSTLRLVKIHRSICSFSKTRRLLKEDLVSRFDTRIAYSMVRSISNYPRADSMLTSPGDSYETNDGQLQLSISPN
jgi:hypothetical protein